MPKKQRARPRAPRYSDSPDWSIGERRSGPRGACPGIPVRGTLESDREHADRSPARPRGHDVRLVRGADRAQAERARGRRGDRQPRDRAGDRERRRRRSASSSSSRAVEAAGYGARPRRRHEAATSTTTTSRSTLVTRRLARRRRAHGAGRAARDGAAAPVRGLGVGRARALDAGRLLSPAPASIAPRSKRAPRRARRWTR